MPVAGPSNGAEWPALVDLMALPAPRPQMHARAMDDHAAVIAMLDHTWFGSELAAETQERLVKLGEIQNFEADEVILREGDDAKEMGILISGRLALRTLVPERGPVTILSVEPGDIFGWSAVLPDTAQAQSTVVAPQASQALVIEGTALRAALKEDHALAASLYPRVLKAVARRLRQTRLQLLDLFAR